MRNMNIANIANGALVEQVDIEIERVLANIMDPNTDTKIQRKITIVLNFKCDDDRDVSDVRFITKSVLAPQRAIVTRIAFDRDSKGTIIVEEMVKNSMRGQMGINEFGEIVEPQTRAKESPYSGANVGATVSRIVNIK